MARPLDEFVLGSSALSPGETPLVKLRPSIRLFFGEALQAVTVVGITILITLFFEVYLGVGEPEFMGPWPTFGLGAVGAELFYLGPRLIRALINVAFTEYVLTADRVYSRTEFFSTDLKVLPFEKVTHVGLHRGLFGKMLGIAELRLRSYGADQGTIRLRGLRDPLPPFFVASYQIRNRNTAEALVRSD